MRISLGPGGADAQAGPWRSQRAVASRISLSSLHRRRHLRHRARRPLPRGPVPPARVSVQARAGLRLRHRPRPPLRQGPVPPAWASMPGAGRILPPSRESPLLAAAAARVPPARTSLSRVADWVLTADRTRAALSGRRAVRHRLLSGRQLGCSLVCSKLVRRSSLPPLWNLRPVRRRVCRDLAAGLGVSFWPGAIATVCGSPAGPTRTKQSESASDSTSSRHPGRCRAGSPVAALR